MSLAKRFGRSAWLMGFGIALALAGTLCARWLAIRTDGERRDSLLLQARLAARSLDVARIGALSGTAADLASRDYLLLKEQMGRIRSANPKCRFIYLMRRQAAAGAAGGRIVFLADSEPPDSRDCSPAGQAYEEVPGDFLPVFETGIERTVGPFTDRWGTWVTALIPMRAAGTGALIAVLGMDVDANTWRRDVIAAAAMPEGLMLLVLVLLAVSAALAKSRGTARAGEAALRESHQSFRSFFDSMTDPAVLASPAGKILFANRAIQQKLGYDSEAFASMQLPDLHPPDVRAEAASVFAAMLRGDRSNCQLPLAAKDGSRVPVEIRAWLGRWGDTECIFGVCRDLSAEQEATQRFERLFRFNPSPMALSTGPERRFSDVNNAFLAATGYARDEVIGRTTDELGLFPNAERQREGGRRLRTDGRIGNFELELRRKDGSLLHGLFSGEAIGGDRSECFLTVMLDITERKQADAALQESLLFRREAEKIARIGAWKVSPETDYLYWTEGVYEILEAPLDYKPGLEEGMKFYDPESIAVLREALGRALRDGTPFVVETGLTTMTGKHLWTEVRGLGRVVAGEQALVMGTFQDITARKQAEQALRESERRFRSALDNMMEGCQIIGFDWRFRYVNATAARQGRSTVDAMVGHRMMDLYPGIEKTAMFALLKRCMEERASQGLENEFRFPDGSTGWFQLLVQPVSEGIFILSVDITERKELEAQLRQAQKIEAIGQLAGGVAHDFNNILASMMMHLGILQISPSIDAETQRALNELDAEARRAAHLTGQLLMFSRRSVLAVAPVDLNDVVANLLKMLNRLIGEHIELRFDGARALPPVAADASLVEQAIINMVINARDAMPKGGRITLGTSVAQIDTGPPGAHGDQRPGRFACLAVSDTGCGMDAETRKRIFEPFFTTKEAGKGTGLGLATVHGIVAQHKGWIEVDSEPGAGSTFRIFLPATAPSAIAAANVAQPEPLHRGHETILLVEDDPGVRRLIVASLHKLGYRVHEAATGQEAMTLWQAHGAEVDLLLTDMMLPEGTTGLELTERLRALKPGLKVIISSGYSAEFVEDGAPTKAGVLYLPKPYDLKLLARVVRSCIEQMA